MLVARGTLQEAATISKTTETIMGSEVNCAGYSTLTIWVDYVKGDETGLYIVPYFIYASGGTAYQDQSWTSAAGDRVVVDNRYYLTATGNRMIVLDVRGIEFAKVMQGGTNDGTPTGTVAATFTLTEE